MPRGKKYLFGIRGGFIIGKERQGMTDRNKDYYYCFVSNWEFVIHGSKIIRRDGNFIEASEIYQITLEKGKMGYSMMKVGIHKNVTVNFDFISVLDEDNKLFKTIKEFEISREANTAMEGNG
jgi:hypothetical protein